MIDPKECTYEDHGGAEFWTDSVLDNVEEFLKKNMC